ncbi:MAG: hypothetical protein WKF92_07945 [Pyrinomonadaceae bacterium]
MAEEKSKSKETKIPFWEWLIAIAGLILIIGSVGTVLYRAVTGDSTPPDLTFHVNSIEQTSGGYVVKFSVTNSGNETAAGLMIEGTLKNGEETAETSTAALTYAPANSVRQGGLLFTKNPNNFKLQIRALGYEQP